MNPTPMSQVPLLGRAWEMVVTYPANAAGATSSVTVTSSAWEPEALRMVFEVNLPALGTNYAYWFAKIDLYNLSPTLAAQLLNGQGATVTLSAGYQTGTGRYNVIFRGEVYQAMFERVDIVDNVVTLMCYTGLAQTIGNFSSVRGTAQMTQIALVQKICAAANTPVPIGAIDATAQAALSQRALPRARAFFGDPHDFIDEVASGNGMLSWYGSEGVNISRIGAASNTPEITYDGASGQIIGTPQQTQNGLTVNVLLDPNLKVASPPQVIELVNTQINQLAYLKPGYPPILSPNGTYLVCGLQYNGDTKGEDWKTEIVALLNGNAELATIMAAAGKPVSPGTQTALDPRSPR